MTTRAVLVGAAWTITALGAGVMTTVAVMITEVEVSGPWLATFAALGGVVVVYASVGAILALRRPRNIVGLILPLRRRVQSAVDRRFDRAHYDAQRTVAAFSDRLREEVDIATVTTDLHATIRDAVKPTSVQLWIREGRS